MLAVAIRVLEACDAGTRPHLQDLWVMQLSVRPRDAADLLLPHEDVARKLIVQM
jgi:hypothetical protein